MAPPAAVVGARSLPSVRRRAIVDSAATKLAPKVTATMVGVPMPLAPAPAPAVVAPPSAALEATLISPATRRKRAPPGAAFTLPANPLSDLDGADLASFIELQLHETDGGPSAAGPTWLAKTWSSTRPRCRRRPRFPVPRRPSNRVDRRARALSIAVARRPSRPARWGLLLGLVLRSGAKPAHVATPAPAAPVVAAPAPIALPALDSACGRARPGGAGRGRAGPPGPRRVRGPGDDQAGRGDRGVGEIALGTSPIAHAPIPCGPATVTVSHERYQDVTRSITAKPGESAIVTARLARPRATALLASRLPNALIKLNGRAIGPAGAAAPGPARSR